MPLAPSEACRPLAIAQCGAALDGIRGASGGPERAGGGGGGIVSRGGRPRSALCDATGASHKAGRPGGRPLQAVPAAARWCRCWGRPGDRDGSVERGACLAAEGRRPASPLSSVENAEL